MFNARKFDFLIDLDSGTVGTFIETKPIPEEEGLVDVYYVPLGWNVKTYIIKSIPESAIVRFTMPAIYQGGQIRYTVITENSKGQSRFFDQVGILKMDKLNDYREKLSDEQFKSRSAEFKAKEAGESLDKQKKKERERRQDSSSFNRGYPGFRPPFRSHNQPPSTESSYINDL